MHGGSGEIRTHGGLATSLVFKTRAIILSATLPLSWRKKGVIETLAFRLLLLSKQWQHPRLHHLPLCFGAVCEVRTRDLLLGKQMYYQLY